jgi:hypothetical protein
MGKLAAKRDHQRCSRLARLGSAGLIGATWVTERPVTLWNSLGLIFSEDQALRIATLSTWIEPLPVYSAPDSDSAGNNGQYVKTDHVEEKVLRGIRSVVEDSSLQALALEPARDGSTLICLVTVAVDAGDLQPIASNIEERIRPWLDRTLPELSIQFSSVGASVDPDICEAPLSVVLLQPLVEGAEALDALALETAMPNPKFQARSAYAYVARATEGIAAEQRNGLAHLAGTPT